MRDYSVGFIWVLIDLLIDEFVHIIIVELNILYNIFFFFFIINRLFFSI